MNNVMRRGLTLLELLMAVVIFVVLLGIVWNVALFVSRAETRRGQQAEQRRIVQTWSQMMHDDFRSAIQDTEQLNKAEGGETIRHFGLSGTATQLRIDVSNYTWRSGESSELRTIFYDFQQASGLARRETDYAAPKSVSGIVKAASEIVGCKFRYFDGGTWQEHWASLDRKGVPSAVEVTFHSLPLAEAKRWRQQTNTLEPTLNRVVVQIPAASQAFFESYKRAEPPKKPEEIVIVPPPPIPSPSPPPQPQPPPPPSPFHSLFGDD
jgi:type II secretion system protein J